MAEAEKQIVILDADDTLFLLKEPISATYQKYLAAYGVECLREQLAFHAPIVWSEMRRMYLAQDNLRPVTPASEKDFWFAFAQTLTQSACGHEMPEPCFEEIYAFYARRESRVLRPGALEFLDFMLLHQLPCALITNNDVRIHALVQEMKLGEYFSFVLSAAEIGHKKPSQKFYDAIELRADTAAEDIFYLGNDLELDILPTMERNWKSVWLRDGDSKRPSATPSVTSFAELQSLFEMS